jgi:hypothetical protein
MQGCDDVVFGLSQQSHSTAHCGRDTSVCESSVCACFYVCFYPAVRIAAVRNAIGPTAVRHGYGCRIVKFLPTSLRLLGVLDV